MSIPSRVLYVNLSDGSSRVEPIDPSLPRDLIGGYGINNKLAYDLMRPGTDPLSPENLIIIGAGPFAGTLVPGSAKVVITTRFPINGAFATAAAGGSFALMLKSVGYDHVIISGRASKPVFLRLTEENPELVEAGELWGMDAYETDDALRRRYEPCSIIPIGPAGENLVRSSVAFVDKAGTIGRGGLPAVMGSKNLKAIVVQLGKVPVRVVDRLTFHRLANSLHDRIMRWPNRQLIQDNGLMPAPSDMAEVHRRTRRPLACPSCPLADKVMVCLDEGPYAGLRTYMPHLSTYRFSARNSTEAYEQSIKYSDALNRYGIGGTNFSGIFHSIVDLYRQGIITREDTGGIELKNDIETALELIRMTAYRQGFGEVLAEGPAAVERLIGERAIGSIAHIKGNAIVYDPRLGGLGTMEFEEITTPRGAHVAAAGSPSYNPGRSLADFIRHGQRMGVPEEALKRLEESGVFNPGRYSKYSEDWYALFNCLSLCNRAQVNRFYHIDTISALYEAVTGIKSSPKELMQIAERAWTIGKLLSVREGFDRRHDHAPEAWFHPLMRSGEEHRITDYDRTVELTRKDIERFLDDYYEERGYDRESGLPTRETLRKLGLENMAEGLDLPESS
jgi:aldehyde:ferredoxin oxidoreductase